ncbi:MAG: chloride channel protein [Gemmatimonadales bacterium]
MRALHESARTVSSTLAAMKGDEHTQLLVLAVTIGAAAGGAVLVFYKAIDVIQDLVLRSALRGDVPAQLVIPGFVALALVVCRALVRWGASDSPGENIPDVMYRVTVKGGVIRSLPVVVRTLGAAVIIGTGGSVGAEGPVVVLGAAAGSRIGRWLRASPKAASHAGRLRGGGGDLGGV